jgi:hypothetical protein
MYLRTRQYLLGNYSPGANYKIEIKQKKSRQKRLCSDKVYILGEDRHYTNSLILKECQVVIKSCREKTKQSKGIESNEYIWDAWSKKVFLIY